MTIRSGKNGESAFHSIEDDGQMADAALSLGATPRSAAEGAVQIGPVSRFAQTQTSRRCPVDDRPHLSPRAVLGTTYSALHTSCSDA
jgi:hypothetical protein